MPEEGSGCIVSSNWKWIPPAGFWALLWAAFQAIYWASAISLRHHLVLDDGELVWRSGGPGRFLPWPRAPGMLQVLTPFDNPLDLAVGYLVYYHLWVLVAVATTLAVYWGAHRLLRRFSSQ
jgi:hypothetical protein